MAFSPPAMILPTRILHGNVVSIVVVGGENSIQRPGVDCYSLALVKRHNLVFRCLPERMITGKLPEYSRETVHLLIFHAFMV